jgi:3D (Asp-Asp-Asp) domain-containing protein
LAPTDYGLGYLVAATAAPRSSDAKLVNAKKPTTTAKKPGAKKGAPAAVAITTTTTRPTTTTTAAMQFLGDFLVTCYDNYGYTRSGALAGPQSVAVDPRVIPMGSQIYVDGVGDRTADDTGGAIIGHHIDIWEPTYGDCVDWGARTRAVYRVDD